MTKIAPKYEVVNSALLVIPIAMTVEQLRQAQALALPLRFELSLEKTDQFTEPSVGWVSKQPKPLHTGQADTVAMPDVNRTLRAYRSSCFRVPAWESQE